MLKKSQVLKEGRRQGLMAALKIIESCLLNESAGTEGNEPRILGVDGRGQIVLFLGWKGGSVNDPGLTPNIVSLYTVTQKEIDDMNDLERMKSEYGYLWRQSGGLEGTGRTLDDYMEDWRNAFIGGYADEGRYLGHNDTYNYQFYEAEENLSPAERDALEQAIGTQGVDWEELTLGDERSGENIDTAGWKCVLDRPLVNEINDILWHRDSRR